ncbi:MAG: DUF305 domain-containing protein [Balneolaceae bacterium]
MIKIPFSFNIIVVVLMIFGTVACKNTDSAQVISSSEDKTHLEEIYWARVDSARMAFTDADVDFMNGMIGHHAQALIMSELAPVNGADPVIQTLAARIINAQKDEIETMQQWLRDRGQPVPEIHIDGLNLMIHGEGSHHSGHMNMPGMLSQDQLEELRNAQGSDFDRLFLTYMIEHHQGAVIMVKNLFSTDGAATEEEAFRLASDIQVDQITEIERMKLMLSEYSDPEKEL